MFFFCHFCSLPTLVTIHSHCKENILLSVPQKKRKSIRDACVWSNLMVIDRVFACFCSCWVQMFCCGMLFYTHIYTHSDSHSLVFRAPGVSLITMCTIRHNHFNQTSQCLCHLFTLIISYAAQLTHKSAI